MLFSTTMQDVRRTWNELENKPDIKNIVINILNSKTNEELEVLSIKDRTKVIMEASKLITNNKLSQVVHDIVI